MDRRFAKALHSIHMINRVGIFFFDGFADGFDVVDGAGFVIDEDGADENGVGANGVSTSTFPLSSTGKNSTSKPSFANSSKGSRMAGCSTWVVSTCFPLR